MEFDPDGNSLFSELIIYVSLYYVSHITNIEY